jgi:MATE family multidrug resistance protein
MAALNRDILIRSLLLEAIFVSFLFFGAGLGDTILAANQVLLQFLMVTAYALDGFAFAAEALVAQAYGAKNRLHLRKSALLTSAWAFGTALLIAACFAAAGAWIIDLMAKATNVQSTARIYLAYLVLVPPLGCAAFMLDGIFGGATRSVDMRNMMVVSALIYAAALAVLLPNFGNHGLWSALLISLVARGVTLSLRYPRLEASVAHGPKD